MDCTAATAAESIYSRIITRYGCIEFIQSDNSPHFVNDVIRYLTETLRVRHRLSMPYYPQSNGKVKWVIGTLQSMLKRTVAAAATAQAAASDVVDDGGNVKVFGVRLDLDSSVLDTIAVVGEARPRVVEDVDDAPVVDSSMHWASLVHTVLWVYRASPHNATGLSPALLALGRELKLPIDILSMDEVTPITDEEHKECIARRLR